MACDELKNYVDSIQLAKVLQREFYISYISLLTKQHKRKSKVKIVKVAAIGEYYTI